MEIGIVVALALAAFIGAFVQNCIGFGLGVVAAPVVVFVEPSLMPVSILVAGGLLAVGTVLNEWEHVDWNGLGIALLGRIPGMLLGVSVIAFLRVEVLEIIVAVSVLGAVALSIRSTLLRKSPLTILAVGAVSGFTGTTAGIGGPPMALLYRAEGGARLRATLGAYLVIGSMASVALLSIAGKADLHSLLGGLIMVPFVGAGFLVSVRLRASINDLWLRRSVLILTTVSALVLILRAVL